MILSPTHEVAVLASLDKSRLPAGWKVSHLGRAAGLERQPFYIALRDDRPYGRTIRCVGYWHDPQEAFNSAVKEVERILKQRAKLARKKERQTNV